MKAETKTDWDSYYNTPYKTATITRKITTKKLLKAMKAHLPPGGKIAELGGANSCFYEAVMKEIKPSEYHIVDNNALGLDKFRERIPNAKNTFLHLEDVTTSKLDNIQVDLVYSVGLIEHFSEDVTARVIEAHCKMVRPGGAVLITFPTPTFLYRATRALAETFKMWIFHDERPLKLKEVENVMERQLNIVQKEINWPIILTQGILVGIKKNPASLQRII